MDGVTREQAGAPGEGVTVGDLYLCSLVGIGVTALLFLLTDYYTSTRFGPVKKTAAASQTGHATNIIQGLAQGLQATALPAVVLVLGILAANELAGIYGVGVAVMGQLSLTGLIVALDAFGPITDNAGGIAEMADMPESVRNVTDPLDAVGNTTKAVTKGYAIGSAVLAAVVLFAAFVIELDREGVSAAQLRFDLLNPEVLIGLILGGLMVCLFAALSMESAGRAGGAVVEEVRRQFREKPGIMDGTDKPDYAACVGLVTAAAQREMILPSLLPILLTLVVGLIDIQALGGLLIGVIVVGFFFAVLMTAGGGAWDNRSEEHTSEPQSRQYLVCRLLLEKKNLTSSSLLLLYILIYYFTYSFSISFFPSLLIFLPPFYILFFLSFPPSLPRPASFYFILFN